MDLSFLSNIFSGAVNLVANNPVVSIAVGAAGTIILSPFIVRIYLLIAPIKKAMFFVAPFLYYGARVLGRTEEKIKNQGLEDQVKLETGKSWDFLGKFFKAGIKNQPMPSVKDAWETE